MLSLLPPSGGPALRAHVEWPTSTAVRACDAIVVMIALDGQPDRRLPDPARWRQLHAQVAPRQGDLRIGTVGDKGLCVALLAYCRKDAEAFEVLDLAGKAMQQVKTLRPGARRLAVVAPGEGPRARLWQEALLSAASAHAFILPSAKKPSSARPAPQIERVDLFVADRALDLPRISAACRAGNLVRYLTALPPNVLDAAGYQRALRTLCRRHGLRMRWFGEPALRRLGAGAFLAVSQGSATRAAGIARLTYRPRKRASDRPDVCLVGKGIVFDTGGTNLKPHRSMLDMHTDMAGSAVALATLIALAELGAPVTAEAWLAITDNAIGPKAYRPQDIVRASNGTTIQVIHSDAEGRMVLADTLALATRERPRLLVDFATLTGACVYSLTERMSGVFTNREPLVPHLLAAGRQSGERVWPFPLDEDFDSDIESSVADVAQCAVEGKGDHILAARFLSRFVAKGVAWVHVDLSSATRRGGLAHVPTEITGFGVRFALSLLLDRTLPLT